MLRSVNRVVVLPPLGVWYYFLPTRAWSPWLVWPRRNRLSFKTMPGRISMTTKTSAFEEIPNFVGIEAEGHSAKPSMPRFKELHDRGAELEKEITELRDSKRPST